MKLHFFTNIGAPYSFNASIEFIENKAFQESYEIVDTLMGEDVLDQFIENYSADLTDAIDSIFDMKTNGRFNWHDKDKEYRLFYNKMLMLLNCDLEDENGIVHRHYTCELSEYGARSSFSDTIVFLYLGTLCYDNGNPAGTQLALNVVQEFMEKNKWHIGFWDAHGLFVNDIVTWSKSNVLNLNSITPVVWFGLSDDIVECWSITPDTTDYFINLFWSDYFNGALPLICNADVEFYYSEWEYALDYDS